uniref:Uncharacterized protein n=1 Tax=Oryza brachyantha TaxID=4533 RepID=J3N181_ORYBR
MERSYQFGVAAKAVAMVMLLLPLIGHAGRLPVGIDRKGGNPAPFPPVPTEPFPPPPAEPSSLAPPCRRLPLPTEPSPLPPCQHKPPTAPPPEPNKNTSPSSATIVV